ncbi:MAG: gamma carbonic anhydrase family protein [Chloroflexi bacterium]|nr:gamma carbonic anhydrase family protein [Chloroflexota bacterium]
MIITIDGKTPRIAHGACISRMAFIAGDVEIGEDSSVWPGAVIRADIGGPIKIGSNTHIEDNAVLHGPMEIGDNVIIGHNASIHATKIGNNAMIGMNATVLQMVEIGEYAIIGAHAMVNTGMKIPPRSVAVGMPAKVQPNVSERSARWMERTREGGVYSVLARKYKEAGF